MFLCLLETVLGKEAVNATLPVGVVMCRAIRDYYQRVGYKVILWLVVKLKDI